MIYLDNSEEIISLNLDDDWEFLLGKTFNSVEFKNINSKNFIKFTEFVYFITPNIYRG